ncbi:MAG TPA: hypothetical protein DCL54_07575, partial [Alphaproteobacteria bacterium]|nr:hypothetical protein [Alphaproteobacteria bacterium]
MSGALDAIFARLSANARAAEILADLDRLPPEIASRGRALLARGIALNRASEPMAALSALTRAADQFQEAGDA